MQEVITVEKLTKSYGKQTAIDGICFSVERGTFFGLLGANGAGKSTAVECILGTKTPDYGQVSILGLNPKVERRKLFERVGVQFQEATYQDHITVSELCEVTASLYRDAQQPSDLLRQFGISDKRNRYVKDLSGGEKQRLFIVLALIPKPEVVFLDELTTGLDVKARREVWKILNALKEKGLTVLLTSHFMDEVEILCDRICILREGKIAFYGTISEAIQSSPYHSFEDTYIWYAEGGQNENI